MKNIRNKIAGSLLVLSGMGALIGTVPSLIDYTTGKIENNKVYEYVFAPAFATSGLGSIFYGRKILAKNKEENFEDDE